jgi:hypothetical protein
MDFMTCPRCCYSFAADLGDRTRVSCPNCLRTFDPYEPLPPKPDPVRESEAQHGRADDLLVDPGDAGAHEPHDLDLTQDSDEPDDDGDSDLSVDFDEGL